MIVILTYLKTSRKLLSSVFTFLFLVLVIACKDSDSGKDQNKNKNATQDSASGKSLVEKPSPEKASAGKWNANAAEAQIKFTVKGLIGTVHGSLSGLKSSIRFDPKDLPASAIEASVDPKSISTGVKARNKHLQEEKYLEADRYPAISFKSDQIKKAGNGYSAIGNLTIKGVTRKVEIPFQFSEKGNNGVFKGKFSIRRKDFHVGGNGGSVGNTVNIDLEVPVTHS